MADDPCTPAQRRLLEEIRQLIHSGTYYPIFQAVFTSSPATIRFIGRGSNPGHTLACQRTDLLALIRQQPEVPSGQIAAVLIGEEATLKYFHKEKSRIRLQPANPAYEPIVIEREYAGQVRVIGKVVGILRTMEQ